MKVEYRSNNSGGDWWLTDQNWIDLEAAGWYVEWGGLYFCNSDYEISWSKMPANKTKCGEENCHGHRKYDKADEVSERWLGSLAQAAWKEFDNIHDALKEFERVTGQDVSAEGCNCCGAPHSFSWDGGYGSGNDLLQYLYNDVPGSLREAVERLNKRA